MNNHQNNHERNRRHQYDEKKNEEKYQVMKNEIISKSNENNERMMKIMKSEE